MDKLDKRMNRYASELQKFLGESKEEAEKESDSEKIDLDALADELATATEEFVSKIIQIADAHHISQPKILGATAQLFIILSVAAKIKEE